MTELTLRQQSLRYVRAVLERLPNTSSGHTYFSLERVIGLHVPILDDELLHDDWQYSADPPREHKRWKQLRQIHEKMLSLMLDLYVIRVESKEVYQPPLAPFTSRTLLLTRWGRWFARFPDWLQATILFPIGWLIDAFGFMKKHRFKATLASLAWTNAGWLYHDGRHYLGVGLSAIGLVVLVGATIVGWFVSGSEDGGS